MRAAPMFASGDEYVSRLADVGFWAPHVVQILERHGLGDAGREPVAGFNATYPTFLSGEVVVKLFGFFPSWRTSHAAERAALTLVAADPAIAAPRLMAEGQLYDDCAAPWPYLVTSCVPGVPSWRAGLSAEARLSLAAELGRRVRRLHALAPACVPTHDEWRPPDMVAGIAASSLPPHLAEQVDGFLARLGPFERVLVHGDLTANHVYVEDGCLAGIIDWGDVMVTDRHYELIQLHRDLFGCDKRLLRTFLEASDWPIRKDFARQALGLALHRQAIGVIQHHTMDVFEPVAALLPLQDIATLDDLAMELFGV